MNMAGQMPTNLKDVTAKRRETLTWFGTPTAQTVLWGPFTARTVIERVNIRFATAGGAAAAGHLARVANGAAVSTNTDVTATSGFVFTGTTNTISSTDRAISGTTPVAFVGANAIAGPTQNIVEIGESVILEVTGTIGSLAGVQVSADVCEFIA